MKKIIGAAVCGLLLAGCATQKPQMPDEKYVPLVRGWIGVSECIRSGGIDADTGARGRAYIIAEANQYQHNPVRFKEIEQQMRGSFSLTSQDCREMAAVIQSRKQQIDNQNASAEIQRREVQNILNTTKPTQAYCNKIGTQVLCNSF